MNFKKIISEISFSPSSIGQLNLLHKKVKRDKKIYFYSFIILLVALLALFIGLTSENQSINTASTDEMISLGYGVDPSKCNNNISVYCINDLSLLISANNITNGNRDASSVLAKPNDIITYSASVVNNSSENIEIIPEVRVADLLEYSEITDNSNGIISGGKIIWDKAIIGPNEEKVYSFTARILSKIPSSPTGKYYKLSYDNLITLNFGNVLNISITKSNLESFINLLDIKYITANLNIVIITTIVLLLTTLTLYIKSRQIDHELKLIREDNINGSI